MINCQKDWGGVHCASSALWVPVMEQASNLAEACSIDEQVDVDHDVHADSVSYRDENICATESPGVYPFECAGVLLQLSRVEGRSYVDQLL